MLKNMKYILVKISVNRVNLLGKIGNTVQSIIQIISPLLEFAKISCGDQKEGICFPD